MSTAVSSDGAPTNMFAVKLRPVSLGKAGKSLSTDLRSECIESPVDSKSYPNRNERNTPLSESPSVNVQAGAESSINTTTSKDSLSASVSPLSSSSNSPDNPGNMSSLSSNSEVNERRLSRPKFGTSPVNGENSLTAYLRKEKPTIVGIPAGTVHLRRASFRAAPTIDGIGSPNTEDGLTPTSPKTPITPTGRAHTPPLSRTNSYTLPNNSATKSTPPVSPFRSFSNANTNVVTPPSNIKDKSGHESMGCGSADSAVDSTQAVYFPNSTDSLASVNSKHDAEGGRSGSKPKGGSPFSTPKGNLEMDLIRLRSIRASADQRTPNTTDNAESPNGSTPLPAVTVAYSSPDFRTYTFDELKTGASLPVDVDPSQRELYLDNETFTRIFGMDKSTFSAMRKWKKDTLKKKYGIF
mmetsp:Transcript_26264/g.36164  ORF Transcript_26264/g.36164 Transcript_26264/m.36164 type:complete len:410 (+) Transcript_26264:40-1269(+)